MNEKQYQTLKRIYGDNSTAYKKELDEIYQYYIKSREKPLLDIIASTVAMVAIVHNSKTVSELPPQMEEAFRLQYPNVNLDEVLQSGDYEQYLNGWKGKYFEVLVRDQLRNGEIVGDIQLNSGQTVQLAENSTNPGWDLVIVNRDGSIAEELQLKATDRLSYIKNSLEQYPDIRVITTEEVFDPNIEGLINSGIKNEQLTQNVTETVETVSDYGMIDAISEFVPGLPFLFIATTEGKYLLTGKKTFEQAFQSLLKRSIKSGVSIGAGTLVYALDGGLFSIPTTLLTKAGIDRFEVYNMLHGKLKEKQKQLETVWSYNQEFV